MQSPRRRETAPSVEIRRQAALAGVALASTIDTVDGRRAPMVRLLTPNDYRSRPWKNGAGRTTEIAVHPAGAGLDAFAWRVSIASVERNGPFSAFPGIDRTIVLLDGAR